MNFDKRSIRTVRTCVYLREKTERLESLFSLTREASFFELDIRFPKQENFRPGCSSLVEPLLPTSSWIFG